MKFFKCNVCGNIVELVKSGGGQLVCCDQSMEELKANTVDAAVEKHVPVATVEGDVLDVVVGSVEHPMTEEHYIQFIVVELEDGAYRKDLKPNEAPKATFNVAGKKPLAVYEYCNLHGLWKKEL